MMKQRWILALSACALMACEGAQNYEAAPAPVPAPVMASEMMAVSDMAYDGQSGFQAKRSAPSPQSEATPSAPSFLAYRYNYGFELPAANVAQTAQSHADMCLKAGTSKCQLLSSSTNDNNADFVSARLGFRAEPEWLESFMTDIKTSVESAEGRLKSNSVSAEDLTRAILDTDARLKAQTTLRDRLQGLLATRDAKLPDLLALERELARVQGEIESATSTLKALRQRVSMSRVDINYQSKQVAVSQSAVSPVVRALKGFIGDLSYGLASVISFFAAILPWLLLVILPGLWLLRWVWRKRKSKTS